MAEGDLSFYGFPDECKKFDQRHPLWGEAMKNIVRALDLAFTRVVTADSPADKFVYFFGRTCMEDFMETLLVCYHGYGVAAAKLVRSLYEHAVTLRYLHQNPEEVQTFIDYHLIQDGKLVRRLIETFGESVLPGMLVEETRRKADEVREDFMIDDCKKCGTKRLNHTWSKLDFVAMAKKTGSLGELIVPAYFFSLRHAHATFGGLTERLEITDGRMEMKQNQTDVADRALVPSHLCILNVLEVQDERFKIEGLKEAIQVCFQDYERVWTSESPLLKADDPPSPA